MTGILKKHVPGCGCCGPEEPCGIESATYSNDFTSDPFAAASPETWTKCILSGTKNLQWDGSTSINRDTSSAVNYTGESGAQVPVLIDPGVTSFYVEANVEVERPICRIGVGIAGARMLYWNPNDPGVTGVAAYQVYSGPGTIPWTMCGMAGGIDDEFTADASTGAGMTRTLRVTFTRNGSNWDVEYKVNGTVRTALTETNVAISTLSNAIDNGDCLVMGMLAFATTYIHPIDGTLAANVWAYDFAYASS